MDLKQWIRDVPDFPKPGIIFRDISPLLQNGYRFRQAIEEMAKPFLNKGIIKVVAPEARGFIFGAAIALRLNAGIVLVRKPGKLPRETVSQDYALEYGATTLEMHEDAVVEESVLIVDDVLATGGTANAAAKLAEMRGGMVRGFCFLIELSSLDGRKKLKDPELSQDLMPIHSLLVY